MHIYLRFCVPRFPSFTESARFTQISDRTPLRMYLLSSPPPRTARRNETEDDGRAPDRGPDARMRSLFSDDVEKCVRRTSQAPSSSSCSERSTAPSIRLALSPLSPTRTRSTLSPRPSRLYGTASQTHSACAVQPRACSPRARRPRSPGVSPASRAPRGPG